MSCASARCKADVLVRYYSRIVRCLRLIPREINTLQAEIEVSIPCLEPVMNIEIVPLDIAEASVTTTEIHRVDDAQNRIAGEQGGIAAGGDVLYIAVAQDRARRIANDRVVYLDRPPVQAHLEAFDPARGPDDTRRLRFRLLRLEERIRSIPE